MLKIRLDGMLYVSNSIDLRKVSGTGLFLTSNREGFYMDQYKGAMHIWFLYISGGIKIMISNRRKESL